VEVLVVISIVGVLFALAFPAVQSAREAGRLMQCRSNLKNIGIALANFHDARKSFPLGSDLLAGTEQAWSARILPFLEEEALYRQIDFRQPWNGPLANQAAANQDVSVYVCPSGLLSAAGKQDYGGVFGTSLLPLAWGSAPSAMFGCGTLIVSSAQQSVPVSAKKITDGLSVTLCVGEAVDRSDGLANRWACGRNCFAQTDTRVDTGQLGGLYSPHPGGAQGLFADGHVLLLTDDIDSIVLGSICTRNGAEVVSGSDLAN
jgi:prepilin-type processing-associated H-X9-DG protein